MLLNWLVHVVLVGCNPVNQVDSMTKYYPGAGWWNLAYGNNKGPDIVGFVGPLTKLFIAEDFSDATEVLVTMDGLWVNNGAAPAWNMDTENPSLCVGYLGYQSRQHERFGVLQWWFCSRRLG